MAEILFQTSKNQEVKKQIPVDLNIFTMETKNEDFNKRIQKLHNQMYNDQTEEAVVGYLNSFSPQTLIEQLPFSLQQMEYKKINNPQREQVLVALYYTGSKSKNNEPITLVRGAKNEYKGQKIDINEKINTKQIIYTTFDLLKVSKDYKNRTQTEADPFKTAETVVDEEVNRLYYLCLRECEARQLKCILIYVNMVNTAILTDARIVTRIFQILTRWEDIKEETEKKEN